ncbi:hypothetical protein LEP1GSC059_3740 [Leptospira noguchii serovar Panama str. CZ214]|uniref:Uncharacterized protein n=1 Tax=Leptospira noguchii serovar Panama str. CZ214 TaxID=1001595 RepID=T0GTM4_9LEPT|nr:hypothetical protein LEP1GSC059_3740 [Leptospira noguchii serovar Panama str. CZ214]
MPNLIIGFYYLINLIFISYEFGIILNPISRQPFRELESNHKIKLEF